MKAVRNTPSSDGAWLYEVSLTYLERIKSYGPDKQKVNGLTDGQTNHADDEHIQIFRNKEHHLSAKLHSEVCVVMVTY
jgi:hypothetical protein